MRSTVILFLIMLPFLSCKKEDLRYGTCEIQYNNISGLPSGEVKVRVTDQNSVALDYTLTPSGNTIILPLETGDRYLIKAGEMRLDSVYNIRFLWSDNVIISYSFMFNNTIHDNTSNTIVIDL